MVWPCAKEGRGTCVKEWLRFSSRNLEDEGPPRKSSWMKQVEEASRKAGFVKADAMWRAGVYRIDGSK